MTLTVIPGKNMKIGINQVDHFIMHMRMIESSMADIKKAAERIGWDELQVEIQKCHTETTKVLKFVKDSKKKMDLEPKMPKLKLV